MTSVGDLPIFSSGDELRKLRYRLGWSQAEMARNLRLELGALAGLERGAATIPAELKVSLVRISQQADSNAECVQRRALAETLMDQRKLAQIHNFDCEPDAFIVVKGRA